MNGIDVNIKMFQVGELGDCFLLKFKSDDTESRVLIDCGSFRNSDASRKRLNAIAEIIQEQLGKDTPLDLVIGTHQHNDHLSGYVHAEDIFTKIGINNVWLSWLDNPKDEQAVKIASVQGKLTRKLLEISASLKQMNNKSVAAQRIDDVLGFYNIAEEDKNDAEKKHTSRKEEKKIPVVPQMGVDILKKLGKKVNYLKPGEILNLPGMLKDQVNVFVLGPPKDTDLLFDVHPGKEESYDPKIAAAINGADGFIGALTNFKDKDYAISDKQNSRDEQNTRDEQSFPFNTNFERPLKGSEFLNESYYLSANDWRKIDDDWLDQAERLALYLDSYTNNSSLVLAFELVNSGKVLLFVGDAQTGNWLSWQNITWDKKKVKNGFCLDYLLGNTVFYKVGHHCSHNATLKDYLDNKMLHPELVAMVPVDRTDPNITKNNGWKMPAFNLYKKLKERTNNRVLMMDNGYDPDCDPNNAAKHSWAKLPFKPVYNKQKLYIEYEVKG